MTNFSRTFNIYLDDIRIGPKAPMSDNVKTDWANWVICRHVDQVKSMLANGMVEDMSLDHDLGLENPSGYDLCKWMVEYKMYPKGDIYLHSSNPVGIKNMKELLENYWDGKVFIA